MVLGLRAGPFALAVPNGAVDRSEREEDVFLAKCPPHVSSSTWPSGGVVRSNVQTLSPAVDARLLRPSKRHRTPTSQPAHLLVARSAGSSSSRAASSRFLSDRPSSDQRRPSARRPRSCARRAASRGIRRDARKRRSSTAARPRHVARRDGAPSARRRCCRDVAASPARSAIASRPRVVAECRRRERRGHRGRFSHRVALAQPQRLRLAVRRHAPPRDRRSPR